jgi:hypothetical protein
MSEIRSAIGALRAEVLADLPDTTAEEEFIELQRVSDLLEAERLRRLADLERRGKFARDGYLSLASWVSDRFRISWGVARRTARVARALENMRDTRHAFEAGDVSASAVQILAEAHDAEPSAFREVEPLLVDAARTQPIRDLRRAAEFWRQGVERERARAGDDPLFERRRLHASATFGGMVRLDGDLDPEAGAALLTALRSIMDCEVRSGEHDPIRSAAQRRADALHEICRWWLDRAEVRPWRTNGRTSPCSFRSTPWPAARVAPSSIMWERSTRTLWTDSPATRP